MSLEIRQISVFIENKAGRLAAVLQALSDNNVSIRAMSASDTIDYGILRLIVNDPETAINALKNQGFTAHVTKAIAIRINDDPGALCKAVQVIRDNDLSVEYIYAFTTKKDSAYVILRLNDNEQGIKVLTDNDIVVVSEEETLSL